jgi:hypothetical protein
MEDYIGDLLNDFGQAGAKKRKRRRKRIEKIAADLRAMDPEKRAKRLARLKKRLAPAEFQLLRATLKRLRGATSGFAQGPGSGPRGRGGPRGRRAGQAARAAPDEDRGRRGGRRKPKPPLTPEAIAARDRSRGRPPMTEDENMEIIANDALGALQGLNRFGQPPRQRRPGRGLPQRPDPQRGPVQRATAERLRDLSPRQVDSVLAKRERALDARQNREISVLERQADAIDKGQVPNAFMQGARTRRRVMAARVVARNFRQLRLRVSREFMAEA